LLPVVAKVVQEPSPWANSSRLRSKAERLAEGLTRLRASWREAVRPRRNSAADLILNLLGRAPVLTAATAAALVERSTVATGKAIDQLVAAGVLEQVTVGKRNRAYEAPAVFGLLTDYERALASPAGDTLAHSGG